MPADGWIDWTADIDFDAGTVTYSAGDPPVALADGTGATALGLADTEKKRVARVTYVGSGAIDDFHGFYYFETNLDQRVETFDAEIKTGAAGFAPAVAGTGGAGFEIGVRDATPGVWYVAFGCATLSGKPTEWKCVSCVCAEGTEVSLDAPTVDEDTNESLPARFFKVYGATEPIDIGTPLSEVLPGEND